MAEDVRFKIAGELRPFPVEWLETAQKSDSGRIIVALDGHGSQTDVIVQTAGPTIRVNLDESINDVAMKLIKTGLFEIR